MKKKEVIKSLETKIPLFYGLAVALIPNDLQAGQIVMDALAASAEQNLNLFSSPKSVELADEEKIDGFQLQILALIYQIGLKRSNHFESDGKYIDEVDDKEKIYYKLKTHYRALLYLKENKRFDIQTIATIVGEPRAVVISQLNAARNETLRLAGINYDWGHQPQYQGV